MNDNEVKECEYYNNGNCEHYSELNLGYDGRCVCGYTEFEFFDCDYVQIKQLTQKLEKVTNQRNILNNELIKYGCLYLQGVGSLKELNT